MGSKNISSSPIIDISQMKKRMGDRFVLDIPHLQIEKGKIVGIVGLNGSGKTTLLNLLVGYFVPTSGSCRTVGVEAKSLTDKDYAKIGYVAQRPDLIPFMVGKDLLRYVSTFYETWDESLAQEMVKLLGLELNKRISAMSPGELQKVALILALSFRPELLLLDEPAAELDPIARAELLELLLRLLRENKTTILISSHVLTDLEKITDSLVLIHNGRVIKHCEADEFRNEYLKVKVMASSGIIPNFPSRLVAKTVLRNELSVHILVKKEHWEELRTLGERQHYPMETSFPLLEEVFRQTIEAAGN